MFKLLTAVIVFLALAAGLAQPGEPETHNGAVRLRLLCAVETTNDLFSKAVKIPGGDTKAELLFPRYSHVRRYAETRPWAWVFELGSSSLSFDLSVPTWPADADAPVLREILNAAEPDLRALAAQALALFDDPEDIPRIAALLGDSASVLPSLGTSMRSGSVFKENKDPDPEDEHFVWRKMCVRDYAKKALFYMTGLNQDPENWMVEGKEFSHTEFARWWEKNKDVRGCLWFWQQRFRHRMDRGEREYYLAARRANVQAGPKEDSKEDWNQRQLRSQKELAELRMKLAQENVTELRTLPPELEAEVRLLATPLQVDGADITEPYHVLFTGTPVLRLNANRLLDLIDRKDLWPNVEWHNTEYNRMVERLALAADSLFKPEHVERLKAALSREHDRLWWSGQTAMIIAIGRLLPSAATDQLDDPRNRDGWLRTAVRTEKDVFVRGYVAAELVHVGLSANWPFLREQFFAEKESSSFPDLRQCILRALGKPPLNEEKRKALQDLLLDKTFTQFWTRYNSRMGYDSCRREAIHSVNVHAGTKLITEEEQQALTNEKTSADTLAKVLEKVRSLGSAKPQ